jgi:hypothetical protein
MALIFTYVFTEYPIRTFWSRYLLITLLPALVVNMSTGGRRPF